MKKLTMALVGAVLVLAAVSAAADPLDAVRERMTAAEAALARAEGAAERAALLLAAGRPGEASALVDELDASGPEGMKLAARIRFAVQDLDGLAREIPELEKAARDDAEARGLVYRWWILRDDLARVDEMLRARRAADDLLSLIHI